MNSGRAALAWAVGVVVLLSLATGPLVGVLTIPDRATFTGAGLGQGSATVTDVDFDGAVRLEAGSFGTGAYHLRAPPVTLRVANVTGRPMLVYKLTVDDLGYSRQTNVALDPSWNGALTLELAPDVLDRGSIPADIYEGTVTVLLRGDGPTQTVFERTVTIEVRR